MKKLIFLSILSSLFLLFTPHSASAQTLTLAKPGDTDPVGYGQPIKVNIEGLPKTANTLSVTLKDTPSNSALGETLTVTTTGNGTSCSTRTTGSLMWQIPDPACKGKDGKIAFTATLRTAYMPKSSSNNYTLSATNGSDISLTSTFLISGSDLTLHIRPQGSTVDSDPIYSDFPATVTVGYCPDNKATFQWWKAPGSDAYRTIQACTGETCSGNNDIERGDTWTFDHSFNTRDEEEKTTYLMRAYCKANQASVIQTFDVLAVNKSVAIEVPSSINPLEAFNVTINGLANDKCYFIILKNAAGDIFWATDTNDPKRIDCGDNDGLSTGNDHKFLPYLQFRANQISMPVSIDFSYNKSQGGNSVLNTGLAEGDYTISVWQPPKAGRDAGRGSMSEGSKLAERAFCVKASCSNTNGYTKPAPIPPPCRGTIGDDGCAEVNSAFGKFKTSPQDFLTRLFSILLSLSGGISLLFIIRSGYQLMTSQGDPEKVKEARERITSAIVGLLFIVFSLVILEVIGVDILAIPGLTR